MSSNRSFGILFFIVFLLIGLWPLINQENPRYIFVLISFLFFILGVLNSKLLTPLNKSWIKFGEFLGRIIAPIVMALVFFGVLTPISLLVRLFGKDLLNLKLENKKNSYWIKRDKKIGSMRKQF
tara:strand:- start:474 stop:845 length:372 start_codon:yes stop_codon:yes gene_type:complete